MLHTINETHDGGTHQLRVQGTSILNQVPHQRHTKELIFEYDFVRFVEETLVLICALNISYSILCEVLDENQEL